MKKIFIFAAAVATLAACQKNSPVELVNDAADNNAIGFSAYTASPVTKGSVVEQSEVFTKGIGVFAFYQPATAGTPSNFNTKKYATPDFMYNQKVTPEVIQTITEEEAKAINASLSGAVSAGDEAVPAKNYTEESAAAYNETLTGAVKAGYVITTGNVTAAAAFSTPMILTAGQKFTAAQAKEYNSNLEGAKTTSDVEFSAVLYTEETAAAYNATLPGAVKAGSVYGDWKYNPIKYWPNNTGDQLSFFAYAPYKADKAWEDLGVNTNISATKMTVTFPIYDSAEDQVDYLWADPVLNMAKPAVDTKVKFEFKHITSQINLFVAAETDKAEKKPIAWTDDKTTITVESVEFKDRAESLEYTFGATPAIVPSTEKQNIILTTADFQNNTSGAWTAPQFYQLNKSTSTMFLAPEALGDVIITYTVETEDSNLLEGTSKITNKITADMSALTLAAGSSYKLNFLIGMTSVKFSVTVDDWATPVIEKQIDVPANTPAEP